MPSLSDQMLAGGCVKHITAVHGEQVTVLSGPDAGKTFRANILETDQDIVLQTDLSEDRRAKRILRFEDGNVPNIKSQEQVRTADGKKWHAVKAPQDGYLTTDFELKEIVRNIDS